MRTDERLGKGQGTETTSQTARDQPGEGHARGSSRHLVWLIPTAAIIIAMAIGLVVKTLDDYPNESA